MDLISIVNGAKENGTSLAFIARKMKRDPSTLNKWLHNGTNISEETEQNLIEALMEIKEFWDKVEF